MGKGDFIKSPPFIVMPEIETGLFEEARRSKVTRPRDAKGATNCPMLSSISRTEKTCKSLSNPAIKFLILNLHPGGSCMKPRIGVIFRKCIGVYSGYGLDRILFFSPALYTCTDIIPVNDSLPMFAAHLTSHHRIAHLK